MQKVITSTTIFPVKKCYFHYDFACKKCHFHYDMQKETAVLFSKLTQLQILSVHVIMVMKCLRRL
jgi:hypothetical protein